MSLSGQIPEAHYCSLPSQSNVYGLTRISMPGDLNKILVASLRGKVISMEFQKMRPVSKEVHFTYIPGDAEIVSIDAFTKPYHGKGIVVGISFMKTGEKPGNFLNIYSEWDSEEPEAEFNVDSIAQGCQSLELNYMPYQLCHTELCQGKTREMVFLLSGSDKKVHLFREDKSQHRFIEGVTEDFFPEFSNLPSNVTWMDSKTLDDKRRLTAYGCENGLISVSVIDTEKKAIQGNWKTQYDSPITSVNLFTHSTNVDVPTFLPQEVGYELPEEDPIEYHLVVASAIELTIVYRNVLQKGLSEPFILPDSDRYDCALCLQVADVDFDGQNEILLGTYGQELLVYKFHSNQPTTKSSPVKEVTPENSPERSQNLSSKGSVDGEYKLLWQRSFSDPLLALEVVDMTGDGLKEIVALSLKGLHTLQQDLSEVADLCMKRLRLAVQQGPNEDVFQQLLSEDL